VNFLLAQSSLKLKYNNSTVYSGIEVGSKGVKMSMVELGKNAQSNGSFNILKDTSVNTDFISFNESTFSATLNAYVVYMQLHRKIIKFQIKEFLQRSAAA
jgi:hypothetical protein